MLVGLWSVYRSFDYGIGNSLEPGSGYFPLILGLLLTGLALLIAVREFGARYAVPSPGRWPVRQLVCIIGGLLVFSLLLGSGRDFGFRGAGLIPAMFVLIFIAGFANSNIRITENVLLSSGLTLASLVIFVALFGLATPLWPWSY